MRFGCALVAGIALTLVPIAASTFAGTENEALAQPSDRDSSLDSGAPEAAPSAASDANAQAEARAQMRQGLDAYNDGFYDLALRHYRKAIELVPEANLPHRHAAKALEALGRWEEAVAEHETYLRIKPNVSDATAIQERIEEIRRTYLMGVLALRCKPEPTEIAIDDGPRAPFRDRDVRLKPGAHTIKLSAPDHQEKTIEVVVQQGTTTSADCALTRIGGSPGPNPFLSDKPPPPSAPWYGRWYTWAGAGLVVAGVVTTILVVGASGSNPPPASEGGNHTFP